VLRFTWLYAVVLCSWLLPAVRAQIPEGELSRPPSPARLDALTENVAREGWGRQVENLRAAAFDAYARGSGASGAWLSLARWAQLFGTPRAQALQTWVRAVDAAGGAHANMPRSYPVPSGSLAGDASPALQRWLIGSVEFSQEFFATLDEQDNPGEVLRILDRIFAANPTAFGEYASLALAIAVVYDVPAPPDWPHGQVGPTLLPRTLPTPAAAFDYWSRLDRANATLHRLRRLPAAELKFVVDTSTPFPDLKWAQVNVPLSLADLSKAYDQIRYRADRVTANQFSWPGRSYSLETIRREGGICVDQAYYAAQVGKARGVPTLLFRGAGLDGRHAWFGYLGTNGWVMDAGRYAEQRYVAGLVRDPQTWRDLTDHELAFLSERFRATPLFQLSQLHAAFAREYLREGKTDLALKAAREAVNRERRNLDAWEALQAVEEAAKLDGRTREGTWREAMQAFARYPDLEVAFGRRLITSLRARGERSLADAEEQRLVRKYRAERVDLSLQQVAEILRRSMAQDDRATQIQVYRRLLEQHGAGAGIDFFDKIVEPFVEQLRAAGEIPAARDCLERARRTLRVESGRQLEAEINRLADSLRSGGVRRS
jgi:hypothetical protein